MRKAVQKHMDATSEESGGRHLDLGIHASTSEQLYALQQLACRFCMTERIFVIIDILICQRYNELIEE